MTSLLPLLGLACTPFPCEEGELLLADGSCSSNTPGGDDTEAPPESEPPDSDPPDSVPIEWSTLPESCSASGSAGDPLTLGSSARAGEDVHGARFGEYVDVHFDASTGIAWAVGHGGGMAVNVRNPGDTVNLGWIPEERENEWTRFYRIEPVSSDTWALTHRDNGVYLMDPRDPEHVVLTASDERAGLEGMVAFGGLLFVSSRNEGILAYELGPDSMTVKQTTAGLAAPWDFSEVDDEGWTYVADNTLGLVPVQLDVSGTAEIHEPLELGAVLHTELAGDLVFAALGSQGVAIVDVSSRSAPVELARIETGGSAVMTAFEDERLWIVDHEAVLVVDVSDPAQPLPLAHEVTEEFALAVDAHEGHGYVGDWSLMHHYVLDPGIEGVDLDVASPELMVQAEGGSTRTRLTNRGSGVLELQGATVSDERLSVRVSATTLGPGESALLELSYTGGDSLDATICLASNDGDGPQTELQVLLGDDSLGQPAPNFTLSDLDGNSWTLNEHLGHPVMLAYFATW